MKLMVIIAGEAMLDCPIQILLMGILYPVSIEM